MDQVEQLIAEALDRHKAELGPIMFFAKCQAMIGHCIHECFRWRAWFRTSLAVGVLGLIVLAIGLLASSKWTVITGVSLEVAALHGAAIFSGKTKASKKIVAEIIRRYPQLIDTNE